MQCEPKPCNRLGRIEKHCKSFRATVSYYDAAAKKRRNIHGPSRCVQAEAEEDLQKIRAAAQYDERHRDLDAMASEALRLKNDRAMWKEDRSTLHLLMLQLFCLQLPVLLFLCLLPVPSILLSMPLLLVSVI